MFCHALSSLAWPGLEERSEELNPPEDACVCGRCEQPYAPNGAEESTLVEIEVKAHKRVIRRPRWRRTCKCSSSPMEVSAPPVPRLFPRTLYGTSFWARFLFEHCACFRPVHRVAAWFSSQGLTVSPGTLADSLKRWSGRPHLTGSMLFRTRDLLVRQRTQTINSVRGQLAEFGVIAAQGVASVAQLRQGVAEAQEVLPDQVVSMANLLFEQIATFNEKIAGLDRDIRARAREQEEIKRLMTIPGVGPICAMAVNAFAPPMESFRRGRDFAAWIGLTPRQNSTAGKQRLGRITKMGQRDLRRLLILGATAVVWQMRRRKEVSDPWLRRMIAEKPPKLVAVALANKMARTIWALSIKKETYRAPVAVGVAG